MTGDGAPCDGRVRPAKHRMLITGGDAALELKLHCAPETDATFTPDLSREIRAHIRHPG